MTFEEWIEQQPDGYYSSTEIFAAGATSRDAEIAGLNQRIDLLSEASLNTTKERNQLSEQLTLLRDELLWHKEHTYNPFEPDNQCNAHKRICKALAATEPKP